MSSLDDEYRAWRAHGGIFDLSDRAKLQLTGADRVRYLNGQVTANVTKLGEEAAIPACVTTAKGRLSAVIHIVAHADALFIDGEPELRESLTARLERYIVADDVTVEDVTDEWALLHVVGADPRLVIGQEAPSGFARTARRFGTAGVDLWVPRDRARIVSDALANTFGLRLIAPELAESIRIEAGIPQWGRELSEETLPPEAGLERTHVDYEKGCYIGQEVISRLKSIGHVNRQLCGFVSMVGQPLGAGWRVFASGDLAKSVGELTSEAWSFTLAKPVALGYLKRGSPTESLVARPEDSSVPPVEIAVRDLPFAVFA